tara:strand:- start:62 stop:334 length:273 start_codon:yes stop_codon:yes gene_type:complete
MNNKFDREAYFKSLQLVKELKEHNENHRRVNANYQETPNSIGLTIKSIILASVIVGIALFVLIGSIVLIPVVVIILLGYGVFLWARRSIK